MFTTLSGCLDIQKASFLSEDTCHVVNVSSGAWVSSTLPDVTLEENPNENKLLYIYPYAEEHMANAFRHCS